MQLLAEAVPGMRRLALVTNPGHAGERSELAASKAASATLGFGLVVPRSVLLAADEVIE